jgi:hypothetical protein
MGSRLKRILFSGPENPAMTKPNVLDHPLDRAPLDPQSPKPHPLDLGIGLFIPQRLEWVDMGCPSRR